MKVYLDNAATTQVDPRVADEMCEMIRSTYGNPSSIHEYGREARTIIEKCRKRVAALMDVTPGEIFFTSGGTEADNTAITCSVYDQKVNHIITSPIEHHAVLHAAQRMEALNLAKVSYVQIDEKGNPDINNLQQLLEENGDDKKLVALMHANNEIGTMIDLKKFGDLSKEHNALFLSDTVQTVGHVPLNIKSSNVDFFTASAHKFNGPKGIGFLYVNNEVQLKPFIQGGSQERNMRGGTENIYGIAGITKALEIACEEMDEQSTRIGNLKAYMKTRLNEEFTGMQFNGETGPDNSLYTVLNASFPPNPNGEMLLFNLDIDGIATSGGSACSSGSDIGSHVMNEIMEERDRINIRFSFGKYNTQKEIDYTIEKLKELL